MHRLELGLNCALHVYRNMVSSSNDHVACIGPDGRFITVNDAFVRGFLERALGGEQVLYEGLYELSGAGQRYLFTTLYPYIDNDGERADTVLNAGADRIAISFKKDGRRAVLIVADNGRGISKEKSIDAGVGLNIMKYRARIIGAVLDIESEPNKGTRVVCRFPM